jgi:leader peptidase (prepilin peptidase) / N-methyltransferase
VSLTAAAAATSAVAGLLGSPYLARLAVTVPDRDNRRWWRGAPAGSGRLIWTAVAVVGLGALGGMAAGWTAILPADIALALFAAPLLVIDVEWHRLPDRLIGPAAITAAALFALAATVHGDWRPYLRALEGAGAVFAALFAIAFIAAGAFGLGDVKLGALLGGYLGWVGWPEVFLGVFAGFLAGTLVAIALLATGRAGRKTPIPFGPMLVVGALTVLALVATTPLAI